MASEPCCSQAKEEQLYMLELLVDRLNLTPEKIQEIGSTPLTVRLEFLDFPAFEINEEEFWSSKKRHEKQTSLSNERKSGDGSLDFGAGKSCLFPKRPNELINSMRSEPLKIGVYKTRAKKICSNEERDTAVCESEVPLSGCLCDQVSMSMNDPAYLPKPYTLRNTWNLIDERGNPSGTILLFLRLTCLGKSIVTQFAVKNESFLFKSSNSSNEFQCSRVPAEGNEVNKQANGNLDKICVPEGYREPEVSSLPKPRSVIGLVSICQELAKRDGGPLEVVPPLKLSTHRMVEEQLPQKRDVRPERSIKDSECVCQPGGKVSKKMIKEFPCGWRNCSGGLCTGPRNVESFGATRHGGSTTNSGYTGSYCSVNQANYRYRPRIRGGGHWNEEMLACSTRKQNNRPKYREEEPTRVPEQSTENLISGACKSAMKTGSSRKPGCGCFGKLGTGAMGLESGAMRKGCSNEPCHGVDCLIRAFKETQDFVESIGKVRGLAGLGLMDPTESPYFGRERDDAPTSCDAKIPASSIPTRFVSSTQNPRPQVLGKFDGKTAGTIMADAGLVSSHHHNIHQADASPMISTKTKKRAEEKSEKQKDGQELLSQPTVESEPSPCGEPSCKSKKKSREEDTGEGSSLTKIQESTKKIAAAGKSLNSRKSSRQHAKNIKSLGLQGPAGDRASSRRYSNIRVSRRIMRLAAAARDSRFVHGHKNCLDVRLRVPGNMGWLWNTSETPGPLKTQIGWKPGAISKYVWERLQQAKKVMAAESGSSSDIRASTPTSKSRRSRSFRSKSFHTLGRSQWAKNRMHEKDDGEIELPPTLHIHRKDGTYYVTMYPVKVEGTSDEPPEENPKPLQFKVTKNRENNQDDAACSSSTGSDMEIEFSPPAAINRYRKKETVRHQDTQVTHQEILDSVKVTAVKRQSKTKKAKKKK